MHAEHPDEGASEELAIPNRHADDLLVDLSDEALARSEAFAHQRQMMIPMFGMRERLESHQIYLFRLSECAWAKRRY